MQAYLTFLAPILLYGINAWALAPYVARRRVPAPVPTLTEEIAEWRDVVARAADRKRALVRDVRPSAGPCTWPTR